MTSSYNPGVSPPSSWAPDESRLQIFAEQGWLQGAILSSVVYGVVLTLFLMDFYILFKQARTRVKSRQRVILMLYICAVFILDTLFIGANAQFTQLAFIDNRNYPGGPAQFEQDMWSIPVDEVNNVVFVLANWLNDAVIVWRGWVIFQSVGAMGYANLRMLMIIPGFVFLGSIILGTLWLVQLSAASPWANGSLNWTIPFFSVSLGLNILVTIMIVTCLLFYRYRVKSVLGPGYGGQYLSLATMLVESAALYAVFSLLFLIPFIIGNPVSEVFLQALGQVQTASSLLIVFRVAQGKGWEAQTQTQMTTRPLLKTSQIPLTAYSYREGTQQGHTSTVVADASLMVSVKREIETLTDPDSPQKGRRDMV